LLAAARSLRNGNEWILIKTAAQDMRSENEGKNHHWAHFNEQSPPCFKTSFTLFNAQFAKPQKTINGKAYFFAQIEKETFRFQIVSFWLRLRT